MRIFALIRDAFSDPSVEHVLVLLMLVTSMVLVAIAFERFLMLVRVRMAIGKLGKVVKTAHSSLEDAADMLDRMRGPVPVVLKVGVDRALGRVRGDAGRAMMREQKRLGGVLRARTWILGTAGALMPFVGLFGTVLGVMASFQAIGESGQGGFAVVSVGISQALIATAVGIAVALEGVVLFNVLQSIISKQSRELALLADEVLEIIQAGEAGGSYAVRSGK